MSETDEYATKYSGLIDSILRYIPYERMKVWKQFFFAPTATLPKNIDSITSRVKDIYVMVLLNFVIGMISILPRMVLIFVFAVLAPSLLVAYGIGFAIIIGLLILSPLFYLFYALIEYVIAKVLGGKADFQAHFNASVLPTLGAFTTLLPISLLFIPLQWLGIIPIVNLCTCCIMLPLALVSLGIVLYKVYLTYLAFKQVHELSSWRAAAVVLIPLLIFIAISIVIAMLVYAAIYATMMAALGAEGAFSSLS